MKGTKQETSKCICTFGVLEFTPCSATRQAEIKKMQEDLRKLKKRNGEASESDSDSDAGRKKRRKGPSYLEEELAKYSRGRGHAAVKIGHAGKRGKREEEDDLLREMGNFSERVMQADGGIEDDEEGRDRFEDEEGVVGVEGGEEGLEVDDDVGWMRHRLKFVVDEKELTRRAEEEYSVSCSVDRGR
jgi:peptidyl-prolyl cis-trans isomerase SDCCAG10